MTASGTAFAKAGAVEMKADEAALTAGGARQVAAQAREEAGSVNKELALTKDEIRRLGPRYGLFVGVPRDEFRALVKPFVRQKLLIVTRRTAGVEEKQLAFLIEAMMHSPIREGWDVSMDNKADFLSPEILLGISKRSAGTSTVKAAEGLAKALRAVGLNDTNGNPILVDDFPELPPDAIELMIGEHIPIIKKALDGSSK